MNVKGRKWESEQETADLRVGSDLQGRPGAARGTPRKSASLSSEGFVLVSLVWISSRGDDLLKVFDCCPQVRVQEELTETQKGVEGSVWE